LLFVISACGRRRSWVSAVAERHVRDFLFGKPSQSNTNRFLVESSGQSVIPGALFRKLFSFHHLRNQ